MKDKVCFVLKRPYNAQPYEFKKTHIKANCCLRIVWIKKKHLKHFRKKNQFTCKGIRIQTVTSLIVTGNQKIIW